jgi:2,3-bisphosphoglycerate-independent phosphoglycerate mutase
VSSRPGRGALEASGLGAELAREAAVFREEEAALEAEQKEREREAVRRGP